MITIKQKGSFKKTSDYLENAKKIDYYKILSRYGDEGVIALSAATPKDSGETSISWSYKIENDNKNVRIIWSNSHMAGNTPVAILIQYGHATKNGGFIEGIDFINPTLKPIFDKIANDAWREVTNK